MHKEVVLEETEVALLPGVISIPFPEADDVTALQVFIKLNNSSGTKSYSCNIIESENGIAVGVAGAVMGPGYHGVFQRSPALSMNYSIEVYESAGTPSGASVDLAVVYQYG